MVKRFFILLFSTLFAVSSASAEKIMVVTEYLEPYQVKKADGSLGGVMTEIVYALFNETGDTPNIHVLPWARAYAIAKETKNVFIYSIAHTKARSKHFYWIGEVKIPSESIFVWGLKSQFPNKANSLMELKNKRFTVIKNSQSSNYLKKLDIKKTHSVTYETQVLPMLISGRTDLIIGTKLAILERANKLQIDLSELTQVLEIKELKTELSLAFSKNSDPTLVKRYQQAFKKLETYGLLAEIKQGYQNKY